jgi:hypothetical protein
MEKVDFCMEGPSPMVSPKDGHILMVRFKLSDRAECDTVFCEFGVLSGKSLHLANCRCKTFVAGAVPCDYAVKVGNMTMPGEQVVDIFMLPTPAWYHRLEEDALALVEQSGGLARDVGVLDVLSEMTGPHHE